MQAIQELDFDEDACNINQYIKKRMQNNDIFEIINVEKQDISPVVYHMLQNSQPTSASVEKSFSMLKKLLANDRNFPQLLITFLPPLRKFIHVILEIRQNQINILFLFFIHHVLNVQLNLEAQRLGTPSLMT